MKSKLSRILGVSLTIALLTSLIVVTTPASAGTDFWTKMYPPRTGTSTRAWQLAPNSTPGSFVGGPIAVSTDGTLYAYTNSTGTGTLGNLFKSTDDGHTWKQTGKQTSAIVDIATSPTEASVVFIATATAVLKSADSGATFTTKVSLSGETINSIDTAKLGSNYVVLIGTSASSYGGNVYLYNEGAYPTALTNMAAGTINALAVALSPNFATDQSIFAVGLTNATTLAIKNKVGGAAWGGTIDEPATITATTNTTTADIAFSSDFDVTTSGLANWYIATNGTTGQGIYLVNGIASPGSSFASALSTTAMHSIAVSGSAASGAAQILGGKAAGGIVYSTNGGTSWKTIYKPPSGATNTKVLMASDYATSMKAWAVTSGLGGAVSKTAGSYLAWNAVGLINETIATLNDLAFSGDNIYMATDNGTGGTADSIWKHDGSNWERILYGVALDRVQAVGDTVFTTNIGSTTIYRSADGGNIFAPQHATNTPGAITGWLAIDANTLYTGAAAGYIYKTVNNGLTWTSVQALVSGYAIAGDVENIVKSPIVPGGLTVGTAGGYTFYTVDAGTTWSIAGAFGSGSVVPGYNARSPYHGYVSSVGGGIQQMDATVASPAWVRIDGVGSGSVTANTTGTSGLVMTSGGTLYVTATGPGQGIVRALNPDASTLTSNAPNQPYFETVNRIGTTTLTASLSGLWTNGGNLYAIGSDDVIYVYTDTLATAVSGVNAIGGAGYAVLSWTALASATTYAYEINTRSDFDSTTSIASSTSTLTSKTVASSSILSGRTYYVRIRATAPLRSAWSKTASFATVLGTPDTSADYGAPRPGAEGVSVNPVFTWKAVSGASGYEFVIAEDSTFEIIDYAATTVKNYHGAREQLAYGTTYYWKVRAVSSTSAGSWVYGVFSTMAKPVSAEPVVTPEPEVIEKEVLVTVPGDVKVVEVPVQTIVEQPIPSYLLWTIVGIGGVLVIALIVLIVRTRRVA